MPGESLLEVETQILISRKLGYIVEEGAQASCRGRRNLGES